jgi:hypothetical protein
MLATRVGLTLLELMGSSCSRVGRIDRSTHNILLASDDNFHVAESRTQQRIIVANRVPLCVQRM